MRRGKALGVAVSIYVTTAVDVEIARDIAVAIDVAIATNARVSVSCVSFEAATGLALAARNIKEQLGFILGSI